MSQQVETRTHVRFGVFEADLRAGELRRSGVRVRIQAQPFKVLAVLLERAGEVVSREELQRHLWGTDTTVDFDHSLGIAINKLRDALGDSADNPRFVETLARRGYRFIAPVSAPVDVPAASALPGSAGAAPELVPDLISVPPPADRSRLWLAGVGIIAAASLASLLIVLLRPPDRSPRRIAQITYSGRVLEPKVDSDSISSIATDGSRIFFPHVENGRIVLAEALIANGEIREFKLPSEIESPIISSISPDQGNLLVHDSSAYEPEQPLWIVPALGGDARRVPNLIAHDAAWMPDGKRILYANRNTLYIVRADGTDPQKFTDLPGWAFWLRWSPDGTRLRFSLRDGKRQTVSLWELDSQGKNLHPLLPEWSRPAAECCGSWTADGRLFVFQSRHSGHSDLWIREEGGIRGLVRQAAPPPAQLTSGPLDYESPVAGTAGHRVLFIAADPNIELLQFDPRIKRFAALENTLSSASLNVYSRDGGWVAWLNSRDGSLWRSRVDGSDRLQLTSAPLRVFMMRWSPDNKRLAIMAQQPGSSWRIYLEDAVGGRLEPLTGDSRSEADPNWSSDGTSLVFGRPPEAMTADQEPNAIYTIDLATRRVVDVPGSTGLFSPRLSPDDRYIAALQLASRKLMLYDRQTSAWRTLSDHPAADPLWSADGRSIYFQDGHEDGKPIYKIDITTGRLEQIATLESLRPLAALEYRLIALGAEDRPVVSAWTSSVNLYSIDLDQ